MNKYKDDPDYGDYLYEQWKDLQREKSMKKWEEFKESVGGHLTPEEIITLYEEITAYGNK